MSEVSQEQLIAEAQAERAELTLQQAKDSIALKDALDRLGHNPDWKLLVTQNYFKDEAIRLVLLKTDTEMENYMAQVDNGIVGIGMFRQYLSSVIAFGVQAKNAVDAHRQEELQSQADEDLDDNDIDDLGEVN